MHRRVPYGTVVRVGATMVAALAMGGCVLTPERFFEDLDEAVATQIERCGGPSAPDPDVEGAWTGDLVCPAFDVAAARACLRATRQLREPDCLVAEGDSDSAPGAYEVPSACDFDAICGIP